MESKGKEMDTLIEYTFVYRGGFDTSKIVSCSLDTALRLLETRHGWYRGEVQVIHERVLGEAFEIESSNAQPSINTALLSVC